MVATTVSWVTGGMVAGIVVAIGSWVADSGVGAGVLDCPDAVIPCPAFVRSGRAKKNPAAIIAMMITRAMMIGITRFPFFSGCGGTGVTSGGWGVTNGDTGISGFPQLVQNFVSGAFSAPQSGQNGIITDTCVTGYISSGSNRNPDGVSPHFFGCHGALTNR